ncbi:deoxynucleotide monophosphate kinase family protein [Kitasatospora purpeofusca]|uniref:deoxynucleotide monophosphate kinase family protein n=1 Tax=Kitasatospora purpeofusca TaxID=67352 RepID=UPI00380BFE20
MTFPNIALVGRARAGKDTLAAQLVTAHAYTRVAFADPLKAVALGADPIVDADPGHFGYLPVRLSQVVKREGWEKAKSRPEVRRTLQAFGQAVRDVDPDFWLGLALDRIETAAQWNLPVIVTDCRYLNEVEALRLNGFKVVRVVRPATREDANSQHVSETELDHFPADATVLNTGTAADLGVQVEGLLRTLA